MPRKSKAQSALDILLPDPEERERRYKEMEERMEYVSGLFHAIGDLPSLPRRFVVEDLLPEGYLAILAGDPKTGKTCLASAIALAVATGEDFAGLKTSQSPVLWLSLEESPHERAAILAPVKEADPPLLTCYEHIPIDTPDGISILETWTRDTGAKLLIVDPLHGAHSGRSLHDGWAARKTLKHLKHFCTMTGVATLVLHHLTLRAKSRRVAESAQLSAIASMFMLLSSPSHRPQNEKRLVTLDCHGRGAFANRMWHFESDGPLGYDQSAPPEVPAAMIKPPNPFEAAVLKSLENGSHLSAADIIMQTKLAPSSIRNAVTRLYMLGHIELAYVGSGTRFFRLPRPKLSASDLPDPTAPTAPEPERTNHQPLTTNHEPQTTNQKNAICKNNRVESRESPES